MSTSNPLGSQKKRLESTVKPLETGVFRYGIYSKLRFPAFFRYPDLAFFRPQPKHRQQAPYSNTLFNQKPSYPNFKCASCSESKLLKFVKLKCV
ncbi:hypothetical protein [Curvibacter phage PCA1]|nr:hypothetical protein [Curvibacter phage PCA1]